MPGGRGRFARATKRMATMFVLAIKRHDRGVGCCLSAISGLTAVPDMTGVFIAAGAPKPGSEIRTSPGMAVPGWSLTRLDALSPPCLPPSGQAGTSFLAVWKGTIKAACTHLA